jgi:mitogen-activated protein kinase 1/3
VPDKEVSVFIIMEEFGTSLRKLIDLENDTKLNQNNLKVIFYNCLLALKFLNSANILHRDIKPSNILVDENCHIRICDFGLSRSISKNNNE